MKLNRSSRYSHAIIYATVCSLSVASFACLAVGVLQFDKPFKAKVLTETQERNKIVKRFKIVDFVRT